MASGLENIETVESPFRRFVTTIGVFPTAFTDAMTYYECLAYLVKYMEETLIPAINENAEAVEELQGLYIQLKAYVDNYFDNLDVQEEINNKLDAMVEDGTLQEIINNYLQPNVTWTFNTVAEMKASTNLFDGGFAETRGFYNADDGGGAIYRITDTGTANEKDVIAVGSLYAVLNTPKINVKQFGAKGDGSTDDTTAIQSAVDYAFDHNLVLSIPSSTSYYKVTMPIVLKNEPDSGDLGGYWFGKSSQIIGEDRGTTKIVKVGTSTYSDHSISFVNSKNATFICANQNGTGIKIKNLTIANFATYDGTTPTYSNTSYGIYGNVSRSELKQLNIRSYKGIYWNGFSNLFDNIVFSCTEEAFKNENGTSNTYRFLYTAQGCLNPYTVFSQYSTMMNCGADGCTGSIYYVSGCGLNLIDCGCESPKAQYIIKTASQFSTLTINNMCISRQTGDSANSLALADCSVCEIENECFLYIDGLAIVDNGVLDQSGGKGSIFRTNIANRKVTTTLKNIRYIKNFTGTDNEPSDLWGSNPTRFCVQTLSTGTADFKYYVSTNKKIIPFIGGTSGTEVSVLEGGKTINADSISDTKKIWLDCKSQYETEDGTNLRYTGTHKIGDIQLFNDPLARNALGLSTISVGAESWGVRQIPIVLTGTTANRPTTNLFDGLMYFDGTLHKPVWYYGGYWFDATGTAV